MLNNLQLYLNIRAPVQRVRIDLFSVWSFYFAFITHIPNSTHIECTICWITTKWRKHGTHSKRKKNECKIIKWNELKCWHGENIFIYSKMDGVSGRTWWCLPRDDDKCCLKLFSQDCTWVFCVRTFAFFPILETAVRRF